MSKTIAERLAAAGVDPDKAAATETALANSGGEGKYVNLQRIPFTYVGKVTGVWTKPNQFGSLDHAVALETDEGVVKISSSAKVHVNAIEDNDLNEGDVIVYEYRGFTTGKSGKGYHDVVVKVAKRANAKTVDNGEAPF